MAKPRIAILGGGAGAVTAALELSKPGWEDHYESITLYQQGWRLGGKGACGRGRDLRIEEHGLHLWFGFYENAFRLLDRCHRELDQRARQRTAPLGPGVQERRGQLQPAGAARGHRPRRLRVEPVGGGLLRRRRRPSLARVRPAPPGRAPGPVDGRLLRRALPAAGGRPRMVAGRVRPGAGRIRPAAGGGPRERRRSSTTRSTSRWRPSGATSGRLLDAAANAARCARRGGLRPARWCSGRSGSSSGPSTWPATSCAVASTRRPAPSASVRRAYYVVDLMVAIVRGVDRGRRDRERTASTSSTTSTFTTGCSPTARCARRPTAPWSAASSTTSASRTRAATRSARRARPEPRCGGCCAPSSPIAAR